jgi:hypothetical protein
MMADLWRFDLKKTDAVILQQNEVWDPGSFKPHYSLYLMDSNGAEKAMGGFLDRLDFAVEMALMLAARYRARRILACGFVKVPLLD